MRVRLYDRYLAKRSPSRLGGHTLLIGDSAAVVWSRWQDHHDQRVAAQRVGTVIGTTIVEMHGCWAYMAIVRMAAQCRHGEADSNRGSHSLFRRSMEAAHCVRRHATN